MSYRGQWFFPELRNSAQFLSNPMLPVSPGCSSALRDLDKNISYRDFQTFIACSRLTAVCNGGLVLFLFPTKDGFRKYYFLPSRVLSVRPQRIYRLLVHQGRILANRISGSICHVFGGSKWFLVESNIKISLKSHDPSMPSRSCVTTPTLYYKLPRTSGPQPTLSPIPMT